jgi:hypothetical protein
MPQLKRHGDCPELVEKSAGMADIGASSLGVYGALASTLIRLWRF